MSIYFEFKVLNSINFYFFNKASFRHITKSEMSVVYDLKKSKAENMPDEKTINERYNEIAVCQYIEAISLDILIFVE